MAVLKSLLVALCLGGMSIPMAATLSGGHWAQVKHVIGFGNATQNTKGELVLTEDTLSFVDSSQRVVLFRRQVKSVTFGSERVETGGTAGKVARAAVPYGGGALLGTFTQRNVGILTIRYADSANGLHEAVFLMPRAEAANAQEWISGGVIAERVLPRDTSCNTGSLANSAIRIVMSDTDVSEPEYGALVYEHLVDDVRRQWPSTKVFRGADEKLACGAETVSVTMQSVAKDNAMVRTMTGPIGLFADVTHVHAHVVVKGPDGTIVLDRIYSTSRRGDRESLNAATSLAQKVAKDLRKANRGAPLGNAEALQ